jgi:hypothetical protein
VPVPKLAANALIMLGVLVLAFTAIATIGEILSGIITRRPFTPSSGIAANRAVDAGEFWTQITRRVIGVGIIGGALIALGTYLRRPFASETNGRPPAMTTQTETLRCSFCKKDQNEVKKLIAGPEVFICDECVEVCNDIIADDPRLNPAADDPSLIQIPPRFSGPQISCALCGLPTLIEEVLVVESRGALCGGCVDAIETAIAGREDSP